MFKIGLVINPYAGLGGSVGLKGSDGQATRELALSQGAQPQAMARAQLALSALQPYQADIEWLTAAGAMGEDTLTELGMNYRVVYTPNNASPSAASEAQDTCAAISAMLSEGINLLVFAGGDGTARDVFSVVADTLPVVGIPAGVKIHSGVYAVSPRAAGKVLGLLVSGELTTLRHADVMDIDEQAFRQGTVRAKRYGEMQVPQELEYMQAVKMGGKESDELVLTDIADDIIENMDDDVLYIMGSGSTVAAVMESLGLPNTLLGVDVVLNQELIAADVSAGELEALLAEHPQAKMVITVIGGQGHIFGRGNQLLSLIHI